VMLLEISCFWKHLIEAKTSTIGIIPQHVSRNVHCSRSGLSGFDSFSSLRVKCEVLVISPVNF
jgi:hypothetical protein